MSVDQGQTDSGYTPKHAAPEPAPPPEFLRGLVMYQDKQANWSIADLAAGSVPEVTVLNPLTFSDVRHAGQELTQYANDQSQIEMLSGALAATYRQLTDWHPNKDKEANPQ